MCTVTHQNIELCDAVGNKTWASAGTFSFYV